MNMRSIMAMVVALTFTGVATAQHCCLPDGTCLDDPAGCDPMGGITLPGDCNGPCPDVRACCLPDSTCVPVMTEAECDALEGADQGAGTDCTAIVCPLECAFVEQATIDLDAQANDVAIDGDRVVTTPISGPGLLFERDEGGPGAWGQVASLVGPSGQSQFAAISGDTVVIGAPAGNDSRVYVFERDEGGPGNWGVSRILEQSMMPLLSYGNSVDIDGDTIVVGTLTLGVGVVYVYDRNLGGPNNWGERAVLTGSGSGIRFGARVAISGDLVLVGNTGTGVGAGAAYLFGRDQGGADAWGEILALAGGTFFGFYVDIDGTSLIVTSSNSAFVYEFDPGSSTIQLIASLPNAGGRARIDGDVIVVARPGVGQLGSVRLRNAGGVDQWGETQAIGGTAAVSGNAIVAIGIATDPKILELECLQACCQTTGMCADHFPAECAVQRGTPQGVDVFCADTPDCLLEGACCLSDGQCTPVADATECEAMSGVFTGHGVACGVIPCPSPGACCLPDGSCQAAAGVGGADCTSIGGLYIGDDFPCTDALCSSEIGACCYFNGCLVVSRVTCANLGGDLENYAEGTDCASAACEQRGSCCLGAACSTQTESECLAGGGEFRGLASCGSGLISCADDAVGACCRTPPSRGFCVVTTRDACLIYGGSFNGDGTNCGTSLCPEPLVPLSSERGCCLGDGSCIDADAAECQSAGGEYQDSRCENVVCAGPGEGACCLSNGDCVIASIGGCVGAGGVYQGDGTNCVTDDCPDDPGEGACCFEDGDCDVETEADCVADGGVFQGTGIGCFEGLCPGAMQGACCLGSACVIRSSDACAALDGVYAGDGLACVPGRCQPLEDRATASDKGSLLVFSAIELRWGGIGPAGAGAVLQDTFISLTNDFPEDVDVQMYLINGDPPLAADPATGERAHPGWNYLDNQITLTGDQPTYWSMLTGLPATGGVAPFTVLDPGFPPGRPANDGTGDRVLRGYLVMWAVNSSNQEIRWNHLKGEATIVSYGQGCAWEYGSVNFPVVDPTVANGLPTGLPGVLKLNGFEYAQAPAMLLMNFQAAGAAAFSGPRQIISDTRLAIHPVTADLRQEGDGPVTTKANFSIWNMNEVKFSETHRCVTCWDDALLSQYGTPNSFVLQHLQTPHGKARFDGVASQVCDVDVEFDDGACGSHPDDVCSSFAPLLGVVTRLLTYDGGADYGAAAVNLVGLGRDDTGLIQYDVLAPPPEGVMPKTPVEMLDWLELQLGVGR